MILCKVIATFVRSGESYRPGDTIELEEERAKRMADAKMVEYEGSPKKESKPTPAPKGKKGKAAAEPTPTPEANATTIDAPIA
jgi:hypothetical protein